MATPRARGANHRQAQLLCADARSASRQSHPTRTRASFGEDDGSVAARWDGDSGGGLRRRQNRHLSLLFGVEEDDEEEDDDFCFRVDDAAKASASSSSSVVVDVDDDAMDRSFRLCVSTTSIHPPIVAPAPPLVDPFRASPSARVVVVVVAAYRVSSTSMCCARARMNE